MSMLDDSAVRALGGALDRLGIPWAVTGGVAANVHRQEVRHTGDIDVLVLLAETPLAQLTQALAQDGWRALLTTQDGWLTRIEHPKHGVADIMVAGTSYQCAALERALADVQPDGSVVRLLAAEDVIIHKLIAGRHKDDIDVLSILAAAPALDDAYLDEWADHWNVAERLRSLRELAAQECAGAV